MRGTTKQKHTETCRARLFEAEADDDRVVRSTKRIEEYVARKVEEQEVQKRRVDFENSEEQFQEPFGYRRDDVENGGMDFDGEVGRERRRPPRPLGVAGGHGPSKKPRQLSWEDTAHKIEDGVCAGAEDMKIDGVLVNGFEVNQDEEFAPDDCVFDELSGRWLDEDKVAEARSEEIGYIVKDLDMFVPATWKSASPRRASRRYRPSGLTLTRARCRTRSSGPGWWPGISASRASPRGPISLRRCRLWRPDACCCAWPFGVVERSRVRGTRSC